MVTPLHSSTMDVFTKFNFLYTVSILALNVIVSNTLPDAEYSIFEGFDIDDWVIQDIEIIKTPESEANSPGTHPSLNFTSTTPLPQNDHIYQAIEPKSNKITELNKTAQLNATSDVDIKNTTNSGLPKIKLFTCPEAEKPTNIGQYEVPTQRDLVLLTMKTLHRMFNSYHQKAMLFLNDMQQVMTGTEEVARKCRGDRYKYVQCVKHITTKCETITKSLITTLEQQRADIIEFGKNKGCSLQAMKEDPVKLAKILASEEISLDFALPGFLRLVNVCNFFCESTSKKGMHGNKPPRHLTDTDIVIRHFLTKKSYKRLLSPKEPKKHIYNIPIPVHKRNP